MAMLIPVMILLPLATAAVVMVWRSADGTRARWISLLGTLVTLAVSLVLAVPFRGTPAAGTAVSSRAIRVTPLAAEADASPMRQRGWPPAPSLARRASVSRAEVGGEPCLVSSGSGTHPGASTEGPVRPRLECRRTWLTLHYRAATAAQPMDVRLEFYFGMDGISLVLVVLTAVLMVSSVLVSWEAIRTQTAEFYACLLLLETGLLGAFCAFDLLLFYVFFEVTLIPLFFLIGIWGGPERQRAAYKFFLYTLAGSALTLVGLIALVLCMLERGGGLATPFSIPDLARELGENGGLPEAVQWWIFLGLSAGFVIKVPLFPFHTWLPLAHTEAPTAGSVVLAGVLLKLGTYGFLRLCLPLLPQATWHLGVPLVGTLAVIGIVYGALCSLAQQDIKKLVAYSSVSHLGFCMLGMFALNAEGISGSVLQMVNHGLSTGALFLLVGMIYERYHTRRMGALGGLAGRLPLLACGMVFICLSSVGLPGLNGFVGEWLALSGMFRANRLFAVVGATGIILGAWYLLSMLQRSFFGPLKEPDGHRAVVTDLQGREIAALAPIVVLCLWIGIYPRPVLDAIRPDVEAIARVYQAPPAMSLAGRAQVWDDSASRLWTVVSDRPDRMENPAPGGSNSEEEAR